MAWHKEPARHELSRKRVKTNQTGIGLYDSSYQKTEYSRRYKNQVVLAIYQEMEKIKSNLEEDGYKVQLTRDRFYGVVMDVDNHKIEVYPSVNTGSLAFTEATVELNDLPPKGNMQDFLVKLIASEANLKGLTCQVKEYHEDKILVSIESRKPTHSANDSVDTIKTMVNLIKKIDKTYNQ